jgi:flagellar hook-basal body complex protein FliE
LKLSGINVNDLNTISKFEEDLGKVEGEKRTPFSQYLKGAMEKVNELQLDSQRYKELLAVGEVDNLHDVAISAEKANISLQLVLGIRNKVVEAYREIMRMQI